MARLAEVVGEYYQVSVEAMRSRRRTAASTRARQLVMVLAIETTTVPLFRIARYFHRGRHAVYDAERSVARRAREHSGFRESIEELRRVARSLAAQP